MACCCWWASLIAVVNGSCPYGLNCVGSVGADSLLCSSAASPQSKSTKFSLITLFSSWIISWCSITNWFGSQSTSDSARFGLRVRGTIFVNNGLLTSFGFGRGVIETICCRLTLPPTMDGNCYCGCSGSNSATSHLSTSSKLALYTGLQVFGADGLTATSWNFWLSRFWSVWGTLNL